MLLLSQVGYAAVITLYALAILLFGYTFLLADTEGHGFNGRISRFIYIFLPEKISRVLSEQLGPSAYSVLADNYDYVVHQKNPVMQIV